MTSIVWLPPLVRALATALIVVSASAVAEALGPFWGALITSLPVSSGPAYVFLAMQHGADFVAASSLSSFAANAATGLLLIVYGVLGGRTSLPRSLGPAVLAWLAASLTTQQIIWTPFSAFLLNLAVYSSGIALLGAVRTAAPPPVPAARRQWSDIPVRAVAVAVFVSLVVAVSSMLGPNGTGVATAFPISFISLIVIVRSRIGSLASSALAANALRPMFGFGMVLLTLHLAIRPLGIGTALVVALLVSACWSIALLLLRRRLRLG